MYSKIVIYNKYFNGWEDINNTSLFVNKEILFLFCNKKIIVTLNREYVDFLNILNHVLEPFQIIIIK